MHNTVNQRHKWSY